MFQWPVHICNDNFLRLKLSKRSFKIIFPNLLYPQYFGTMFGVQTGMAAHLMQLAAYQMWVCMLHSNVFAGIFSLVEGALMWLPCRHLECNCPQITANPPPGAHRTEQQTKWRLLDRRGPRDRAMWAEDYGLSPSCVCCHCIWALMHFVRPSSAYKLCTVIHKQAKVVDWRVGWRVDLFFQLLKILSEY